MSPSPLTNDWQQLWEETLPNLSSNLPASIQSTPRKPRAGQLDAESLDDELVALLNEPITNALSLLSDTGTSPFEPELLLLLKALLFKYLIWDTGISYGSKLQGLRFSHNVLTRQTRLSRRPLILLFVLSIIFPYSHARLRNYALSKSWPDLPSSASRRRIWGILSASETAYTLLSTTSFVLFLWKGRYRNLSERISGLSLSPIRPSSSREVSYEFMNRQMAWHAFTDFLLFAVPLVHWRRNFKKIKRSLSEYTQKFSFFQPDVSPTQRYTELTETECAICLDRSSSFPTIKEFGDSESRYPIQTPYVTSCGHRYCYFCVSEKILQAADEDSYWNCLRCSQPVYNILREHEEDSDNDDTEQVLDIGKTWRKQSL